jgi:hypothetical protein
VTITETNQLNPTEAPKHPQHRLRNFLFGVGAVVGGLALFNAHEVKDPAAGITVVGAGTGVIEDLTGKDNIYLDWVDVGAMAVGAIGATIALGAATKHPETD